MNYNKLPGLLKRVTLGISLASAMGFGGTTALASASPTNTGFPDSDLSAWKQRSFKGSCAYDIVDMESGIRALKGTTDGQASVLYREKKIDLTETPWLGWHWKVDNIYEGINEQSKSGDDFPARLYVVVKTGRMPWQTRAINYVWASNIPEGEVWKSPYTGKAVMVAVNSGSEDLGEWVYHQRNIADDFKTFFGLNVKKIDGYALMVDGDNTGLSATAWFGDVSFSSVAAQ